MFYSGYQQRLNCWLPIPHVMINKENHQVGVELISKNENVVVWGGIEPPTQGFSVLCSTD